MAKRCFGCMRMKENNPVCEHCGYDERTQNSDHQLPTGTVLGGQYLIGKALGQGGFGITYLAWDQVMNQPVAVKEYFPKGFASRTMGNTRVTSYDGQNAHDFEFNKKRFLREAESLAKLWDIPHIVKILRYFEENGTAYIVMEYVQGVDLRKHLKKLGRPLTMDETLSLMGPVAKGLGLVHKIDLVHRDISPDNIMVLPDGSTKLLDFGAARFVENANADQERLTSTQAVLKHGFAPPEQYRTHGALGPWTDVYALCATMYYCLSGRVPPDSMSRGFDGISLDWASVSGLSYHQKSALEKGMALQPKDRFSSVEELWKQLMPPTSKLQEVEEKQKPAKQEESTAGAKKQYRKRRGLIPLVAVVIGAALFFGIGREEKPAALSAETTGATAPETEAAVSATDATTVPVQTALEIAPSMDLKGVDLGYTQSVPILSGHDAGDIQWTSSNPQAAIVSEGGVITAAGYGTAEITGRYQDQQSVCVVSVDLNPNITCTLLENKTGWTIIGYEGDKTSLPDTVVLPREQDGKRITSIGGNAFAGCSSLTGVIIPDGVTSISESAFEDCSSLSSVTIPDSITSIGGSAFSSCSSLASVTIPDSVNSIGDYAFQSCSSLRSVTIPDSVNSIGNYAFESCSSLRSVTIPDGVTSIGNYAFQSCSSLRSVTIPDSVTSIGNFAFRSCSSLRSVTIPDSVTSIGKDAFVNCSGLTSVTIPDSVTSIGEGAFSNCSGLTGVTIPDSVTSIAAWTFYRCSSLTSVTISDGVTYIGYNAFSHCSSLTSVSIPDSVIFIDSMAFDYCSSLRSITISKECGIGFSVFPDTCTVNRR